jgi:hypothetical protein
MDDAGRPSTDEFEELETVDEQSRGRERRAIFLLLLLHSWC